MQNPKLIDAMNTRLAKKPKRTELSSLARYLSGLMKAKYVPRGRPRARAESVAKLAELVGLGKFAGDLTPREATVFLAIYEKVGGAHAQYELDDPRLLGVLKDTLEAARDRLPQAVGAGATRRCSPRS